MAEYQVNSGNGVELTRDSYHKPRCASPMTASMPRATSSPPCRTRSPGLPGLRVACRAHARLDSDDDERRRARSRLAEGGEHGGGREGARPVIIPIHWRCRVSRCVRRNDQKAYLDIAVGILTPLTRVSSTAAPQRSRHLRRRSVVAARVDEGGSTAPARIHEYRHLVGVAESERAAGVAA